MKPLELIVYPHVMDGGWDCIEDHEGTLRIDRELDDFARAKRFTDAELAAEYFGALAHFERMGFNEVSSGDDWDDASWSRIAHPMQVLHRFATLTHYDEPTP